MNETQMVNGESCTGHALNCKFCKKPITVWIAVGYDVMSDPKKIIGLAACNTCSDLRVWRRSIEAKIKRFCMTWRLAGRIESQRDRGKAHQVAETLLKDYAHMIARWHFLEGMTWDDECVDLILDKPEHWADILTQLWKLFTEANPERA